MALCSFCNLDISDGTNKVKRKKLDGTTTEKFREVLASLCSECFPDATICFKPNSYICHHCKKHVEGLPELLRKAEEEKKHICDMLNCSLLKVGVHDQQLSVMSIPTGATHNEERVATSPVSRHQVDQSNSKRKRPSEGEVEDVQVSVSWIKCRFRSHYHFLR